MYEIFGLQMSVGWYIALFFVCQLINVALNTLKTIIMHKEEKISSSLINALTYGFYAIIVVMTASNLPLWITIIITIVTNLIGVYTSMLILEKIQKDRLWEIVATVGDENNKMSPDLLAIDLKEENIAFNRTPTSKEYEYVFHIYSYSKKESIAIKKMLWEVSAKYIVHEEKIKL